jgi:uncharacterized protein YbjT (DUF2867 family)
MKPEEEQIMSKPLILVTGATGTVGSQVVKQLAATGQRVRALVRDPKKAERFPKAVEVVHGDLEKPATLAPAFAGVDKAFVLSAGPMLPAMEFNAFVAAKKGGVGHIVKLSARHVDADFMAPTPLAHWHRDSEQRLRSLGIPWTILRPGTFASNVLYWLDRKNNAIFLPVGDGRDSFVDPRDIAAVAVALLTLPGQDGRIYEISGSEWLSFAQVAQKISELTGKQASYHNIPEETAKQGMLAMGMPLPLVESMLSYYVAGIRNGKMYAPTSTIRDVLGRPARSFDEWVRDHRAMLA